MALRKPFQPPGPNRPEPVKFCPRCASSLEWSDPWGIGGGWVCRECGHPMDSPEALARDEIRQRNQRREYDRKYGKRAA